ncbi:MAG: hypothetical protein GF315_14040, partial [candidate division Zixibacteria bacterium]|nr:hypothetical protein [candidate division Zixibacteria bacterium]
IKRLSSGTKINSAADDPAGSVLMTQLNTHISEIEQQISNMELNSAKLSVADGYLSTLSDNLTEMRSSVLRASSDSTLTDEQRQSLQQTVDNIKTAYNNTVDDAALGDQKLLDGSDGSVADMSKFDSLVVTNADDAELALEEIDDMISEVSTARAELGAEQEQEIASGMRNLKNQLQNLTASQSAIADTDFAEEYSGVIANDVKLQAAVALLSQGNLFAQMVPSLLTGA